MARTVGEELYWVRREVDRYFISWNQEFERLGYPKEAAFAKNCARGTVSLPPTPDDPMMERVGLWISKLCNVKRYILASSVRACDGRTIYLRARSIGISDKRYSRDLEKMLRELKGYLTAFIEITEKAA